MKDFRNVGRRADAPQGKRPAMIGHATPAVSPVAFGARQGAAEADPVAFTGRQNNSEAEAAPAAPAPTPTPRPLPAQLGPGLVRKLVGWMLQAGGLSFIAGGAALMAFQPADMPAEAAEVVGPILIFIGVVEFVIGRVLRGKARAR